MKRSGLLTALIVLMLVFIWGNSLLSREVSGHISDTIMEVMNRAAEKLGLGGDLFTYMTDSDGDGEPEATSHLIRKAAHVTEFAVFAALVWLRLESRGRRRFLTALLCGTATAAIDETLQIFSHRGSQLTDVGIDTAGVLLGLAIVAIVPGILRRKPEKDAPAR